MASILFRPAPIFSRLISDMYHTEVQSSHNPTHNRGRSLCAVKLFMPRLLVFNAIIKKNEQLWFRHGNGVTEANIKEHQTLHLVEVGFHSNIWTARDVCAQNSYFMQKSDALDYKTHYYATVACALNAFKSLSVVRRWVICLIHIGWIIFSLREMSPQVLSARGGYFISVRRPTFAYPRREFRSFSLTAARTHWHCIPFGAHRIHFYYHSGAGAMPKVNHPSPFLY